MTHLTITRRDGQDYFEWNWAELDRDINTAIRRYEYSALSKAELEERGRALGIELDRRKKVAAMIDLLIKHEYGTNDTAI